MLGPAALAMWWDMDGAMRAEFEHWHTHEHFPERLALPGFLRASRWAAAGGGEGFFILYELAEYEALTSPQYLARLNAPSDWSRQMMPYHRNMVRSQARVLASGGGVPAAQALTVRLSPNGGEGEGRLRAHLEGLVQALPQRAGIVGAHLLRTDSPAIAPTTEQKIRGLADRAADWIVVVTAYEPDALEALAGDELCEAELQRAGAAAGSVAGRYALRACMAAADVRGSA